MESNGPKIQDVMIQNLSFDLVTFYHSVVAKEMGSYNVVSNKKILKELRNKYSMKLRSNDYGPISFDTVGVRCSYMFQYCPSFTLAIASHFLMLIKALSIEHVKMLSLQDTLTVCCLGGGPGTDVVAIFKVLQEVRRHLVSKNGKPLSVDVTVVDSEPGWSTTAECVVQSLSELVDTSVVKVNNFKFLQYDVTKNMSEDVARVLKQSKVVTMTKFLSALHGQRNVNVWTKILQVTCDHMSDGSFLFLLDSSGWNCLDQVIQSVCSFVGMESVYGPYKKTSRLSKTSKAKCVELFSAMYGRQCCTVQSSNKAAVWYKRSPSNSSNPT